MDTELAILKNQFEDYKEITNRTITKLSNTIEAQEKRIVELERNNTKTDLQYEQIMKTLNKLNEVTIPSLTLQLEELKNKPVKRYDQVITAIISALVGGGMGFAINNIFGGK